MFVFCLVYDGMLLYFSLFSFSYACMYQFCYNIYSELTYLFRFCIASFLFLYIYKRFAYLQVIYSANFFKEILVFIYTLLTYNMCMRLTIHLITFLLEFYLSNGYYIYIYILHVYIYKINIYIYIYIYISGFLYIKVSYIYR